MHNTRKKIMALLVAILTVVGVGVAYAYWTGGGSGIGSAATGEDNSPVTAVQTSTVTDLHPGGTAQNLSGTFTNPTGNGPVYVTKVTASIDSVDKASGAPGGTCTADDYVLADEEMTVGAEVAVGSGQGSWSGATLRFNNTNANQDGCKGATVNLAYVVE